MSNIEVVSPFRRFSTSDHSAVNIDILYAKTSVTFQSDKQDKYKVSNGRKATMMVCVGI